MIYRLQRKFILICTLSVLAVILLVLLLFTAFNVSAMNRNLDLLADGVSDGGGRFSPQFGKGDRPQKEPPPKENFGNGSFDFITPETPFATRHFTVWFDTTGEIVRINTESVYSVTEESAAELAAEVTSGSERGWVSNYRYKQFPTEGGSAIVFIDGSVSRSALLQSVTIAACVLLGCAALVLLLILLLSKRAVKPIAQSYEKQKQFITDANHELKTPLTLILANLDIAEDELGKNEWLEDIRTEGHRMTELVNQLVSLSRLDEENTVPNLTAMSLDELVRDAVADFTALSRSRGKELTSDIDRNVTVTGDEMLLRRLVSILLDNAVKYCDEGGEITVTLKQQKKIVLTVENTYAAVASLELDRVFDRFWRADRARKFTGGYGIGLSLAKAITEQHKGEITAYKKDDSHIGFRVTLRK